MGRTKRHRKQRYRYKEENSIPSSVHHELLKFLANSSGWENENRLTISSFPSTGRGLRCKKKLSADDVIIELPLSSMISLVNIENDESFQEIFDQDMLVELTGSINFQALLALFLQNEMTKSAQSNWIHYLRTLPKSFTNPLFCKKSELYFLPDSILQKIVEQNELIKRNFQLLMKAIKVEYHERFTLDMFKWSFFVCNTRSVFVNSKLLDQVCERRMFKEILSDSPNMALAPLLDLLNHSCEAETKNQLIHRKCNSDKTEIFYQLQTLKPVKKHQQIFINYGTFNNTKLLIEYGFFLCDNRVDFLEFSLDDINNYIKSHCDLRAITIPKHKYKFIRDHELDQQIFIDTSDGLSHNFQAILSILLLPRNMYNLEQVAFGDDISFEAIKTHAKGILEMRKLEFEQFIDGLEHLANDELSESGKVCIDFFHESIKFIDKVLKLISTEE